MSTFPRLRDRPPCAVLQWAGSRFEHTGQGSDLAEETGGSYFETRQISDVPAIFTRIGQQLHEHYARPLLSRVRRVPISPGVVAVCAIALLASTPAHAQVQNYQGKLTLGVYTSDERTTADVNVRYSAGNWTGWLGWYGPQSDVNQGRAGLEYDLRRRRMVLIPSIQAAAASFVGGSIYSEIGQAVYAIVGVSRTDLKPYVNLNFDPNESWQLGAGAHFGRADTVAAFTIWDNRLHTAQQNSHVVVRHYFAGPHRVTLDASYKSGRGDTGTFVRGMAVATEVDWHRWFVKAARDAHVNYSAATMWRFGGGMRF